MSGYRALAEFYDAEYDADPQTADDVPFLLSQMPNRPQRVLDLGTGTGRVAVPLAQAGHRVVGVDNAADVLAVARRKREIISLAPQQLDFRKQDMQRLKQPERFDQAMIVFNTFLLFTTLPQQLAVLKRVHAHLKPGGSIWIDVFNPDLSILAEHELHDMRPLNFFVDALGFSVSKTTSVRRLHNQLQEVTFHYSWFEPDGTAHQEEVQFGMTWIMPREMVLLLQTAGFKVVLLCGDYDGSEITPESSRLIVQARRV